MAKTWEKLIKPTPLSKCPSPSSCPWDKFKGLQCRLEKTMCISLYEVLKYIVYTQINWYGDLQKTTFI